MGYKTITCGKGTEYVSTNTTTLVIPKPAALQDGDWLWLFCSNQNVTSMSTGPSGGGFSNLWTASQTALATSIFSKQITNAAAEPADWTITKASARGLGVAIWFRGVDPTTQQDVTRTNTTNNTGGPSFLPITPVTPGALLVGAYANYKTASNVPDVTGTNGDQGVLTESHTDAVTINLMNNTLGEVRTAGEIGSAFTFTETHTGTNTRTNSTTFALRPEFVPDDQSKFFQFL